VTSAGSQTPVDAPVPDEKQAEATLPEGISADSSVPEDTEQLGSTEPGDEAEQATAEVESGEVPPPQEDPVAIEAQEAAPDSATEVPTEPTLVEDFVLVEPDSATHEVPELGDEMQARISVGQDAPQLPVEELTSIPTEVTQPTPTSTETQQTNLAEPEAKAATEDQTLAIGAGVLGAIGITSAVMVNELFSHKTPSSAEAAIADKPAEQDKVDDYEKLSHPAAEVRSISSIDVEPSQLAEEAAPLSEPVQVLDKGPATNAAVATEQEVEADTTDRKQPTAASVFHQGTQTDDSIPAERSIAPVAAVSNQPVRPGISSEILRAPTPAMVIPDLDDPVAQQLSRARSLRKQRRNTIKKAEELVAAAVVIKAAVDAVSPTSSPQRLASPVNELASFAVRSRELKEEDKIPQPVFVAQDRTVPAEAEADARGRTRTRSIGAQQEVALRSSVADLFLDDKDKSKDEAAAPAPKTDETKAVPAAAASPKRSSHHSSRRHSHHHDRETGSNKDSPRRSHRHRSDSHTSSRSGGEVAEPRTPKRQDTGLSTDSSTRSRRHRTPEEQAAHEKRKEERRLREKEKERERESSKDKAESPSSPKEKPRDKDKEPATSTSRERPTSSSHSHHRSSRRHSKSEGNSRSDKPSPSKTEAAPPSSAGSKKFFDVKNGQSVLETKFPSPVAEVVPAPAVAAPAKDKEAPKPELKRSRSTRHSTSAITNVLRRSEEKIRSSRRSKEVSSNKEKESRKEVKESASGSSGGEGEGEGAASHAAHRAKRQERREKAKEEKKPGFRAAIKRFFTS
jgi:hypothetical protein